MARRVDRRKGDVKRVLKEESEGETNDNENIYRCIFYYSFIHMFIFIEITYVFPKAFPDI